MKIELYYIGKPSKNLYESAEKDFNNRLKHYCNFSIKGMRPSKYSKAMPISEILKAEGKLILEKTSHVNTLILLDEGALQYSSKGFAKKLDNLMLTNSNIAFVIGGAYGFDSELKNSVRETMSLSKMTLPHHMARLVFVEQLYRAFTILNNESYHNE